MRLEKLLRILQENPDISLTDILSGPELQHAAFLLTSRSLVRKTVRALRSEGYEPQRFARTVRIAQIVAAGVQKKRRAFNPDGGRFRKIHPKKKVIQSRRKLRAYAVTSSAATSGNRTAQLIDPPVLLRIDLTGSMGQLQFSGTFWQWGQEVQHTVQLTQISLQDFYARVLGGAYAGDLFQLQFENIRLVMATTATFLEDLPMRAGMNVICNLRLPGGFASIMPGSLKLFGPFSQERLSRSADLRTSPTFDLQLAHITLLGCYLNIATDLTMETDSDAEYWDTFVYLNGLLPFMDRFLPVASDLSTDSGILSFNLDSSQVPKSPFFPALEALSALANGAGLVQAWGPGGLAFLQNTSECRLTKLNIMYDVGSPGLISLSFQILAGNPMKLTYSKYGLAAKLDGMRFDWLVGDPSGDKLVTASASVESASIEPFGNVTWECSVQPWPELSVSCWVEGSDVSEQQMDQWLQSAGGRLIPVANYSGYLFKLYADRCEVFKGDAGQDFPRVL